MKKIIIANFKMALELKKSLKLIEEFKINLEKRVNQNTIVICPDYLTLGYLASQKGSKRNYPFYLGAQSSGHLQFGALTGEVSSFNLKQIGVSYIILGHSERRALGETNQIIREKLLLVLKNNLRPVICLGEKNKQSTVKTKLFIKKQISEIFFKLNKDEIKKTIIAYEPIWAIGTNKACSPKLANQIIDFIKNYIKERYKINIPVIYGGSVNDINANDFLTQNNIGGLLVGGASLSWSKFKQIISH